MGVTFRDNELPQRKYSDVFDECFPFYLAIGMSSAEYWEGVPSLTQYYRKAYRLKQEETNNNMWLQGLYIYDAVSTALHNALRDKNSPIKQYAEKPYNFDNHEKTEEEKQFEIETEQQKAAVWMENFVNINKNKQSH